jgi:internalin A
VSLDFKKPSLSLMRELEEVAVKAQSLAEYLQSANNLFLNFPRSQLKDICLSLMNLPSGTDEGCREPLAYARKRLPAIRREYVSSQLGADDEDPPRVLRGEWLDQQLKDLLASVTTALDQYQVESGDDIPDAVDREISVDPSQVGGRFDAVKKSQVLEGNLNAVGVTIGEVKQLTSENAEKLQRQFKDVENQNRLARAELQMSNVRISWYEPIVEQLRRMPDIIVRTGRAIQIAIDISEPWIDRWNDFKRNTWKHILQEIRDTGATLEDTGRKLKFLRNGQGFLEATPPEGFNLDNVYKMVYSGERPPVSWVPWITDLRLNKLLLKGLIPVEELIGLNRLSAILGQTWDLSPLSNLVALETLSISGKYVMDLSPLSSLREIKDLTLATPLVSDLAPLASISGLQRILFNKNQVSDLTPLGSLKNLEVLHFRNSLVADISPLSNLRNLQSLSLSSPHLKDLSPLGEVSKLSNLYVLSSQTDDISFLVKLERLRNLSLGTPLMRDLEPLSHLTEVEKLVLSGMTRIIDLTPLTYMRALRRLSLINMPRADLKYLSGMHELEIIALENMPHKINIEPLLDLKSLRRILVESETRRVELASRIKTRQDLVQVGHINSGR